MTPSAKRDGPMHGLRDHSPGLHSCQGLWQIPDTLPGCGVCWRLPHLCLRQLCELVCAIPHALRRLLVRKNSIAPCTEAPTMRSAKEECNAGSSLMKLWVQQWQQAQMISRSRNLFRSHDRQNIGSHPSVVDDHTRMTWGACHKLNRFIISM